MASSFFALLDDIATLLDDVSLLTKVAAKKTAGVLGDDLALNAQQVSGVQADRELPVVWAVAKGSFLNKLVLVPAALGISAIAPWAVMPLLMLGGAYLCFEGAEKLAHRFLHHDEDKARVAALEKALQDPAVDVVALEKEKVKGAVRTDFILSAEIIVIALGTVAQETLLTRFVVLAGIALLMTVGVYGLVAGIVKLDDLGLWLTRRASGAARAVGAGLLRLAPWLMKALSVAGTAAMFLVGGSILAHGIPGLEHALESWTEDAGPALGTLLPLLAHAAVGLAAGGLVLLGVEGAKRLRGRRATA
jgi:predicted DNA repair protein MutK